MKTKNIYVFLTIVIIPYNYCNSYCRYDKADEFLKMVNISGSKTDKITTHAYQEMYGIYLMPIRDRSIFSGENVKMLEIGLGCGCESCFGNGSSVSLWRTIFKDKLDLWIGEFDQYCIDSYHRAGITDGAKVIQGDQANRSDLSRWVTESGGKFDIIIDDGGHKNHQIKASLDFLWEHLLPGGIYFIEDLQIGREWRHHTGHQASSRAIPFIDIIHSWIVTLIGLRARRMKNMPPLPKRIKSILCQAEACVLIKCRIDDPTCPK